MYLQFCRISDTATALSTLLGVFVIDNLGRLPNGADDFLSARLTVKNCLLLAVFGACWYLTCRGVGLYDWTRLERRSHEALRVCVAATAGTLVAMVFPMVSVSGSFRMHVLLPFLAMGALLMLAARAVARSTLTVESPGSQQVVIVGTGPLARELATRIRLEGRGSPTIMGFVDSAVHPSVGDKHRLASLDGLERILMKEEVDEVLVALPVKSCYAEIQRTIQICERVGVPVKYSARLFRHGRLEPQVEYSASGPLLSVPAAAGGPRLVVKRVIDIAGSGAALLLLSPVFAAVALGVKLTSPGPVFFSQTRYGRGRRRFMMHKFRTMVDGAEAQQGHLEELNEAEGPVFKIRQDPRITRLGAFLRRTSLDELPQLWNVLRGDMSLVGPRPLPLRDVGRFDEGRLMRRFSVFPGITGLWQVSGRSDIPFEEWIELDLAYIDRWSLTLDLWIMARTIPAVLSGRGAA